MRWTNIFKRRFYKMNLGRIKAKADRFFYYYGRVMQVVTGYGVLKLLGLNWWELLTIAVLSIPAVVLLVKLDLKYVLRKEQEYLWRNNPMVKEILKKGNTNEKT